MKNAMKKSLCMNLTIVKTTLIFEAAVLVLGVCVTFAASMLNTNLMDVGIAYDVIFIMVGLVWFFGVGMMLFGSGIKNSIHMNQSRKQYLLATNVIYLGLMLLFAITMSAMQLIYMAFGALDFVWMISGFTFALMLVVILGVLSVGMLGGALLFCYGKIGLWILYGIFILLMIAISSVVNIQGPLGELISAFLSTPWQGQMLIGVAISGILWAIGYKLIKRVNI